jgi:hypothetical protein
MMGTAHFGDRPEGGPPPGPIEALFWGPAGQDVHKWHHYLPLYDRYFAPYRDRQGLRMLEIGVSLGGSLGLWRQYFGPSLTLFGIDILPSCARFDGVHGQVRIGSQDDPAFLHRVVDEMGGLDIVLDDGSHESRHIRASLAALFPRLSEGGIYMIEDLHAAYAPGPEGGLRAPGSFMEDLKRMIDDLHHWYHGEGQDEPATRDHLLGIHVHDSLVVLEKGFKAPPRHTVKPGPVSERRARRQARRAARAGES